MNNILKYSFVVFVVFPSCFVLGQEDKYDAGWERIKNIEYKKSPNPKGPNRNYIYPEDFDQSYSQNEYYSAETYEEDIIYSREQRYYKGTDKGVEKELAEKDDWALKDLSMPEIEQPKQNKNRTDFFSWNKNITNILIIIIVTALFVFLIYHFLFKNKKANQGIAPENFQLYDDDNPETISENQLKTALEEAVNNKDFRLAIRIYYLFLLKKLILKKWIVWEKQKTNLHYLLEVQNRQEKDELREAVNIYEWTWYGKNYINSDKFQDFSTFYKHLLTQLKNED